MSTVQRSDDEILALMQKALSDSVKVGELHAARETIRHLQDENKRLVATNEEIRVRVKKIAKNMGSAVGVLVHFLEMYEHDPESKDVRENILEKIKHIAKSNDLGYLEATSSSNPDAVADYFGTELLCM